MNNKGQEPLPIIMGLVAGGFAFWMSVRMDNGLIWNLITFALTTVVSYFIVSRIANAG